MRPHRQQPTRLPHPWDSPGKNTGVGCHFLLQCMKVKSESEVAQSCPTLSDPMDCSPPGSPVHGIPTGVGCRCLLRSRIKVLYLMLITLKTCWFCVFIFGCPGSSLPHAVSLVMVSGGYSLWKCVGFSLWWLLLLRSMDSSQVGSVVVAHGLSCSMALGIFRDQRSNPCPLHWQAES